MIIRIERWSAKDSRRAGIKPHKGESRFHRDYFVNSIYGYSLVTSADYRGDKVIGTIAPHDPINPALVGRE